MAKKGEIIDIVIKPKEKIMTKPITGRTLRKLRKHAGLSQRQLAEAIGCNRNSIAWAEFKHPERKLPKTMYEKVENFFDLVNGQIQYEKICVPVKEEEPAPKENWIVRLLKKIIGK